ncbi:MAG: metal-dependent hydrolase [Candidatus Aegiribacteria sp.]|nr:metal-dependent hydrolase [Candidatus Aegiribacteria sp.]
MPNRNVHVPVGASSGLVAALAAPMPWRGPYLVEVISALAGGVLGGRLPDIIDPPDSPRHRGFGHSITCAVIVEAGLSNFLMTLRTQIKDLDSEADMYLRNGYTIPSEVASKLLMQRIAYGFCIGLGAGWLSHLAMDVCMPDGLRLINSKL